MPLVLFNRLIGPYHVLPRWAWVDLGAMAMKGCSVKPKAPALLGHQIDTTKLCTYTKQNRTVYMYKNGFGIYNLNWLVCHKTKQKRKKEKKQKNKNKNRKDVEKQRIFKYWSISFVILMDRALLEILFQNWFHLM